jgi:hypothetical protein
MITYTEGSAQDAHRTAVMATVALVWRLQQAGYSDQAVKRIVRRHPATKRSHAAYLALCDARIAAPPQPLPAARPVECPF